MKRNKTDSILIICAACALFFAFLLPLFTRFRPVPASLVNALSDLPGNYVRPVLPRIKSVSTVIAIAVDEKSLAQINQRWPLRRSVYADALRRLSDAGARVVGFDFLFQGESVDPADDAAFVAALRESRARTVIGYTYDHRTKTFGYPLDSLRAAAGLTGWLYLPLDEDRKVRRGRSGFVFERDDRMHYSFSVCLAAAMLGLPPQDLLVRTPLNRDGTFFVRFFTHSRRPAVIKVSLSDLFNGSLGPDLFKDSVCLVYPAAEINHDSHPTPLGTMDGGLIQLNAALTLASGKPVIDVPFLTMLLVLLAGVLTYAILYLTDVSDKRWLFSGLLLMLGVVFLLLFWAQVFCNAAGLRFDYGRLSVFVLLFFAFGWAAKYALFLAELAAIKTKATIDPLRRLYTQRYFSYRLDAEARKTYLGRKLYLCVFVLDGLRQAFDESDLRQVKSFWERLASALALEKSFWAACGQEEVAGAFISAAALADGAARRVLDGVQSVARESGLAITVKLGVIEVRKEYPLNQFIRIAFDLVHARSQELSVLGPDDFAPGLLAAYSDAPSLQPVDDSLAEDIEEKNRDLLSLYGQLKKEHAKTKEAFFQIIESLVNALEARDPYTQGHSQRVADYSRRLAAELGWPKDELEKLHRASLLHDLGKIGIPDSILHKPGKLNDEEFDFIKKHEVIAVNILKPLKDFEEILPWILYHHERWDGKGYPHGLGGTAIPQASRILSIADVYDALTTGRDYKKALSREETLGMLRDAKGSQFDPDLTERFIAMITRQPPQI